MYTVLYTPEELRGMIKTPNLHGTRTMFVSIFVFIFVFIFVSSV